MERWFPIRTDRLTLREYGPADEADIFEYASDPLVPRYDSWGPNTLEETREHVRERLEAQRTWPRDDVMLVAELAEPRKVIGTVRLWLVDPENSTSEIGYTLNRSYWNRGYATEAASALLEAAFEHLKMHRVIATCDVRNMGSWRVMEKIGMRREAHFIKDKWQRGEWRDSLLYAILADEWACR